MSNQEQLETHLLDIQKQVKRLFNRKGIDPLHLLHLIVYSVTEEAYNLILEEMETVELDDFLEIRAALLDEMERAFVDANNNEKRKRRVI